MSHRSNRKSQKRLAARIVAYLATMANTTEGLRGAFRQPGSRKK